MQIFTWLIGCKHRAHNILWSPALPTGTVLEGGKGEKLDAGGEGGKSSKMPWREEGLKVVSYSPLGS